ncbi:MAG: hypothetical protein ACTTIC_04370 [Helicobacteraceae bacterium]
MSDLEIFELGLSLARVLGGEKEAIADLELLLKRHPEMFDGIADLKNVIEAVAKTPDIVMENPRFKKAPEILAAKALSDKKMGDIIIKNDSGTNVIFHANKSDLRNLARLKRLSVAGENAASHTAEQVRTGASGMSSILSATDAEIIPNAQNTHKALQDLLSAQKTPKEAAKILSRTLSASKSLALVLELLEGSKWSVKLQEAQRKELDLCKENPKKLERILGRILNHQKERSM